MCEKYTSFWYRTPENLYEQRPSRSGQGGEEKNYQLLAGLEPPIIQAVAQPYTTGLSRLL
jgi:hypothetical protein